jgi:hypothetical protein
VPAGAATLYYDHYYPNQNATSQVERGAASKFAKTNSESYVLSNHTQQNTKTPKTKN